MQQDFSINGALLGRFLADLVVRNLEPVLAVCKPEPVVCESVVKPLASRDVEELITGCRAFVWAMACAFARSSDGRLDADDLYGAGMLEICEVVAAGRLTSALNPVAYLRGAARFAMINEWRRFVGWSTISLDKPLTEDENYALYDVLVASVPFSVPSSCQVERARAVRSALRRLTPRRRAALRRLYGLENSHTYTAKDAFVKIGVSSAKMVNQLARRGLVSLRADARLCAVVGVEGRD